MKKRGSLRRIDPETRTRIFEEAIKDRKIPRGILAESLEKELGKKSPSLETLEKEISKARNHPTGELDRPWSIGACLKYNIPPSIVPVLIRMQEWVYSNENLPFRGLTIRKAKWYSILFPILLPMVNPSQVSPVEKIIKILLIVEQYSQREQIAEFMGKDYPDTSDFDDLYFLKGELIPDSIVINWANTILESKKMNNDRKHNRTKSDMATFIQKVMERIE